LIGENIEKLMPEHFLAEQVNHRTHFAKNMHVRPIGAEIELVGRRRDGQEFPLEVSLNPIDDAGRTLIAAAIRDVSDRKRAEAELTVARGAVAALRDLADRANDSSRQSLEAATQELRQPLETLMRVHRTLSHLVSDPEAAEALAQQEHALRALSTTLQTLPSKS